MVADSFRTRIAAAIESIRIQRDGDAARMADAVIAKLGLRREGHPSETITNDQGATFYREGGHRYVTEWQADD